MKKAIATAAAVLVASTLSATAQEPTATSLKEHKPSVLHLMTLQQEEQSYVLKQDGTIRIGPNAAFDAVGVARKGRVIESVGRARAWVAFEQDGQVVFIWEGLLNKWNAWPTSTITPDTEEQPGDPAS